MSKRVHELAFGIVTFFGSEGMLARIASASVPGPTRMPGRLHTGSLRLKLGRFSPSRRFWNALAAVTAAAAGCDYIYQARPRRGATQKRQSQTCQWAVLW